MGLTKIEKRIKAKKRIRSKVFGTAERPRLSVFKSNKEMYAQIIDDTTGVTLCSASTRVEKLDGTKTEKASSVGKALAAKAIKSGISEVVFDRNGFVYHGRIKALAEGAREGGLKI
ncbi:MAG: 50S ribosomal protein L18 [Flavobacteriaceae bacterium]|nr:MAG: 50S ribosomal protein L18 [Flavobacteriaceae bacterium]